MHEMNDLQDSEQVRKLIHELERFKKEDLPPMEIEKNRLFDIYEELDNAFKGTDFWYIPDEIKPQALEQAWQDLLKSMDFRQEKLNEQAGIQVIFLKIMLSQAFVSLCLVHICVQSITNDL